MDTTTRLIIEYLPYVALVLILMVITLTIRQVWPR